MNFEAFRDLDMKKMLEVFFEKISKNLENCSYLDSNKQLLENIKNSEFIFLDKREVFSDIDGRELLTGYLYNIKYNFKGQERDYYENVLILVPDKDGYFYSGNRRLYSPFVIFDKFLTKDEEDFNEEDIEEVNNKVNNEVNNEVKEMDISNVIIIQGYYLAILSTFFRIVKSVNRKKQKGKNKESIMANYINELSKTIGVKYYKYYMKDENQYIAQKIPIFFEPDDLNYIEYYTNPRKVVYPNEKVNENMRLPHESHEGIVDFLETPESEKIGLTLSLVYSDDLEYNFDKLNFDRSNYKLSFATSQIPFILHSDGARILMGSKNLKQSIKVDGAEMPIIFTGYEKDYIGVNALVVYGLFKGFNFEDGIVVSESFSKKMQALVEEEEKYKIRVIEDKHPQKSGNKWIYRKNKKESTEIIWKVKEGDWVYYGDKLIEVFENGKLIKEIRYDGKYSAQVIGIPEYPELPFEDSVSEDEKNKFIEFKIKYRVKKPLEVGDKIMGRHGNKGTISLIVPDNEMPKVVINGKEYIVDVILSPLGVVSRMNIGQLYEVHFSMAKKFGNFREFDNGISPFENGYKYKEKLLEELKKLGADDYGRFKVVYKDNEWYLTAGFQYLVRLDHCVRDKIHVVSFAREGEISYQPLKGRSRKGGQRFGEMEFWAMYSYGNENLIKLFASKNLSLYSRDKYKRYPEDYFKKIMKYFNINLDTSNFMKSKFTFDKNIDNLYNEEEIEKYIDDFMYLGFKKSYVKFVMQNFGLFEKEFEEFKQILKENNEQIEEEKLKEKYKYFFIYDKGENGKKKLSLDKVEKYFSNRNNKRIEEYLKKFLFTKDGYLRNLVIARRLHFSGRTVITPQPLSYIKEYDLKMDIDKVMLPIEFGVEWLKDLEIDKDLVKSALKGERKKRIEVAKILNNYMENNELYVILNRQPSLHRHSIQSFIPRFWHNYTIGLPINVCEGFNADFDGDTMAVYFPNIRLDEKMREELIKMLPSKNPFKLGDGDLLYSIDQDMVYGRYLLTGKNKKEIKKYYSEKIRSLVLKKEYDSIKKLINEEIIEKDIKIATDKNLTLSIFEIIEDSNNGIKNESNSMKKIRDSKCRGKDSQFNQLSREVENFGKGFVQGLDESEYFNTKVGIACRARRTLMDKKLKVADAGYFTRKLVEFLGVLITNDSDKYEEIEIDLSLLLKSRRKIKDVFGEDRFLYRYVKINNEIKFIGPDDVKNLPEKFLLLSPKIWEENNKYFVSRKYLGWDVSKLKEFDLNEYIGISAGHVLGERGTQLSMETFHSGSTVIKMQKVSNLIFKSAFESSSYMEFLKTIEDKFYEDFKDSGQDVSIFNKLNSKSIYFELLYLFAQYLKKNKNIQSVKRYFYDFELRGPLTCMTFEKGLDVLKKIQEGKEYTETHPRIKYSFFWRDEK